MEVIYKREAVLLHEVVVPVSPTPVRSQGRVHLTAITGYISDKLNLFKGQAVDWDNPPREMELKRMLGLAFEEYCAPRLAAQYGVLYHFGEVEKDNIVGSPDGVSTVELGEVGVEVVDELKCSYFSASRLFEDPNWKMRLWQVMGYCQMMGLEYARFWVFHVCGDYKPPSEPRFEELLVRFEKRELEQNWAMLLRERVVVARMMGLE